MRNKKDHHPIYFLSKKFSSIFMQDSGIYIADIMLDVYHNKVVFEYEPFLYQTTGLIFNFFHLFHIRTLPARQGRKCTI